MLGFFVCILTTTTTITEKKMNHILKKEEAVIEMNENETKICSLSFITLITCCENSNLKYIDFFSLSIIILLF
jgi:hypothetical protein